MTVRRLCSLVLSTALVVLGFGFAPRAVNAYSGKIYVGFSAEGSNSGCDDPAYSVETLGAKQAIGHALRDAVDGDIVFLCEGTYDLTTGILVAPWMADELTIRGVGAGKTVLSGGGTVQIMRVWGPKQLQIEDLQFRDGYDEWDGGAICHNNGDLTIRRVGFYDNVSDGYGGAIACSGWSLTIDDSRFVGNTAGRHGGAIDVHQDNGTVIRNSWFAYNHAHEEGGALGANGSDLEVYSSTFIGNTSDEQGGAIWYWRSSSHLTLVRNRFIRNESAFRGGAVNLRDNSAMRAIGRKLVLTNQFSGNRCGESRYAKVGYGFPD